MDAASIERIAIGLLAVKLSFFTGFLIVRLYQGGRLGSFCLHLAVGLIFAFLREETRS